MTSMSPDEIELITKQFLTMLPVKEMNWHKLKKITWDEQETLMKRTVCYPPNVMSPLKISYQKAFVKKMISTLEEHGISIHDVVFGAYTHLLNAQERAYFFKHFLVPTGKLLSLQENVNMISDGTTGLSSWQAGLALAEWCVANASYLKNKSIVELGSGVGITGLVVAMLCNPSKLFLTDCHEAVLQNLCKNVLTNLNQNSLEEENCSSHRVFKNATLHRCIVTNSGLGMLLEVVNLPWEDVRATVVDAASSEVILAADVIYDSALFKPLIKAFKHFLEIPDCQIVLACTQRNKDTLDEFLTLLDQDCDFVEEAIPPQKHFHWSKEIPVRIFIITRK